MTADFFDDLSKRGQEPALGKMQATVRFDIADGGRTDRWFLKIKDGAIDVSRSDEAADCVISASRADFDLVASGRRNPLAAALRGSITMDGNPRLLIRVQRLFPAPVGMPESTGPRSMGKRRS